MTNVNSFIYVCTYIALFKGNILRKGELSGKRAILLARREEIIKDRSKFKNRWLIGDQSIISSIVPFSYLYYGDDLLRFHYTGCVIKGIGFPTHLYDTSCINIFIYPFRSRNI